jgi:hypothetical protein
MQLFLQMTYSFLDENSDRAKGLRMRGCLECHLPTRSGVSGHRPLIHAKTFHTAALFAEWGGFSAGQRLQGLVAIRKVLRHQAS